MAYQSVFDQADALIESEWSMHKYMADSKKWSTLVTALPKLKAAGKRAMQRDGRLDIASYQIYGNAQLDWILLLYNGIKSVGSDEPIELSKIIYLTLEAGETNLFDVPVKHQDIVFTYNNAKYTTHLDSNNNSYVDLNGDGVPDIYIIYNNNGTVTISNVSNLTYTFQVSYIERTTSDYLMAGHELNYPGYVEVLTLIRQINAEAETATTGFARL